MSREEFFPWAQAQGLRHEFDGEHPVAMVGGTINHNRIALNLYAALRSRLRGSACEALCMDAAVGTVGQAVRYPDVLITRVRAEGQEYLVPGVVVVFEVVSKSSGRADRILKVREYRAVPTIRRYVIVERVSIGLTVLERATEADPWIASTLSSGDILSLPEVGVEVPVDDFYDGVTFREGEGDD